MDKELTSENFAKIMSDFLKENEIDMLITLPEGTLKPKITDNTGMGRVVQLEILISVIPPVFKEVSEIKKWDKEKKEMIIDKLLELMKNESMREDDIAK